MREPLVFYSYCEEHQIELDEHGACYMCEGQAKRDRRFYGIIIAMVAAALAFGLFMGR